MIKIVDFILIIGLMLIGCEKNNIEFLHKKLDIKAEKSLTKAENVIDKVKISYFLAPPFLFFDNKTKQISGATYDLIEDYISPEIGVKFEWDSETTTIPRQILGLKNKEKYAVALLTYLPAREEFAIYSKQPYFSGQPMIAVLKSNPITEVKVVDDIKNMVFGYAQKAYISQFMRHPNIQFELISHPDFQQLNLQKTLNHRIDGVYSPGKGSMLYFMKKFNVVEKFRLINLPEKAIPYHVVFTKDLEIIAMKFDKAFEKLGGQVLYLNLLSKYIEVSKLK
jgi:ABC-type amino acid transport substrate-binding protein